MRVASIVLSLLLGIAGLGLPGANAQAQSEVPASSLENGRLWYIELNGATVADGNSLAAVLAEQQAFRQAAAAAKLSFRERRNYATLFNGLSVELNPVDRMRFARMSGVKAIHPVSILAMPSPEVGSGSMPDDVSALQMTGADVAQNSLGLTGRGVKVGIIDTGIDIDHPAFGGNGIPHGMSFPTARVIKGYDFVGDNYDAGGTADQQVPHPDANPDDCNGHGTHVAGIVGGNGGNVRGVAPGVKFGAYRVFGCTGSTSDDVMLAAMERAYADGMNVINMSIGEVGQWPQAPTAQAASRLVSKGVIVVSSAGNSGPPTDALYAAGAPAVGDNVISVASFDNTQQTQLAFALNPGGDLFGYIAGAGVPPAPLSGSLPLARTGTTTTANDGCNALTAGSLTGMAVLIRRGTCGFFVKATNAQAAGASAVILYNNQAGALNPNVAGSPPVTIPVVAIDAAHGALVDTAIQKGGASLTWTNQTTSTPVSTGGLISTFSSFGLAADLTFKPSIGAPGGLIFSSYPLELGGYASLSGTSMASPHIAGAAALVLQAKPLTTASAMRGLLQNSADPALWAGNTKLGVLDHAYRQGAGLADIVGAVQATTRIEPSQISLGESQAGPKVVRIKVYNDAAGDVVYNLSHQAAMASGPNSLTGAAYASVNYNLPAGVTFSVPSITVRAKSSASFNATISAPGDLPDTGLYSGYIALTPAGGGATYRVPFAGLKGDYQHVPILTPGNAGFPWLARSQSGSISKVPTDGAIFTLEGEDVPVFVYHLNHFARILRLEVNDAATGQSWFSASEDSYVGRNSTPNAGFGFFWDGTTSGGKKPNQVLAVPNGKYVVTLKALKALGDPGNPADWETWTSPQFTIARK